MDCSWQWSGGVGGWGRGVSAVGSRDDLVGVGWVRGISGLG